MTGFLMTSLMSSGYGVAHKLGRYIHCISYESVNEQTLLVVHYIQSHSIGTVRYSCARTRLESTSQSTCA